MWEIPWGSDKKTTSDINGSKSWFDFINGSLNFSNVAPKEFIDGNNTSDINMCSHIEIEDQNPQSKSISTLNDFRMKYPKNVSLGYLNINSIIHKLSLLSDMVFGKLDYLAIA